MGLEATCRCTVDNISRDTKVLLESAGLILRSPFRLKVDIEDLVEVEVVAGVLRCRTASSTIDLELGAVMAGRWAKKIAAPRPSLTQKLGINDASRAFIIGRVDDPVLLEALEGHSAEPHVAKVSIAVVLSANDLEHAIAAHEAAMGTLPIWIVHGKGSDAPFGATPVRELMRACGFRDTKISAVSTTLSATRYRLS